MAFKKNDYGKSFRQIEAMFINLPGVAENVGNRPGL
jgi:hypothetical protein